MPSPPFGRENHFFFSVTEAAVVLTTSGFDINPSALSLGAVVFHYQARSGTIVVGWRQSTSALLNTNLSPITPNIVSNPNSPVNTVFRTGKVAPGITPLPPDYFYRAGSFTASALPNGGVFVPPGEFLTIFANGPNTLFAAGLGVIEYLPAPT